MLESIRLLKAYFLYEDDSWSFRMAHNLLKSRRGWSVVVAVLVVGGPCFAAVPFDADAKPMMWHIAASGAVLALLKWRRIVELFRDCAGLKSRVSPDDGVGIRTAASGD